MEMETDSYSVFELYDISGYQAKEIFNNHDIVLIEAVGDEAILIHDGQDDRAERVLGNFGYGYNRIPDLGKGEAFSWWNGKEWREVEDELVDPAAD